MIQTGIITIGPLRDAADFQASAGPALREHAGLLGWRVTAEAMVPDDFEKIGATVLDFARQGCRLILTAGGTGISFTEVTPEAIRSVARLELPGYGETMRREGFVLAGNAMDCRALGAVVEDSLVVALPGCPVAAVACLAVVAGAVRGTLGSLGV